MKFAYKILALFFLITTLFVGIAPVVTATASFNQNDIMGNTVFESLTEQKTNSPSQIDSFINQFSQSCLSANSGFLTPEPIGWSNSNQPILGQNVTVGQAIYDVSQLYNVNPQVIISTLQKEQSLITGTSGCHQNTPNPSWPFSSSPGQGVTFNCSANSSSFCTTGCPYSGGCINIAMGYNCPGYCKTNTEGFSSQLILGTWLLRFGEERADGNLSGYAGYQSGDELFCYYGIMTPGYHQRSAGQSSCGGGVPGNTQIYYDGTGTLSDGNSVSILNGTTSSLYNFTPNISGNQSFYNIFTSWFGDTHSLDYSAQPVWQQIYTDNTKSSALGWNGTLLPGQSAWATVVMKNTGNFTWTKGSSNEARLATYGPWGRQSSFCANNWLINCTRPAAMSEASVAPGQTGTFEFPITAPITSGTYNESFGLVIDGKTTFPNGYMNFQLTVAAPLYSAQPVWQQIYTDNTKSSALGWNGTGIIKNTTYTAVVAFRNKSNFTWTRSGNFTITDTRLATFPWGSQSLFCNGSWLINCTRPAALDQQTVSPEQIGSFTFQIQTPKNTGNFTQSFGVVVEGKSTIDSVATFQITVN